LRHWSVASFTLQNGFYNEGKYGTALLIPVSSLRSVSFSFDVFGIDNIFTSTVHDDPYKDQRMTPISFGMKSPWSINNVDVYQEKMKLSLYNSTVMLYSVNIFLRSYYKIVLETFLLCGAILPPTSITDIFLGSVQLLKLLLFLFIILYLCRNFKEMY
jgi:hypothetical protein